MWLRMRVAERRQCAAFRRFLMLPHALDAGWTHVAVALPVDGVLHFAQAGVDGIAITPVADRVRQLQRDGDKYCVRQLECGWTPAMLDAVDVVSDAVVASARWRPPEAACQGDTSPPSVAAALCSDLFDAVVARACGAARGVPIEVRRTAHPGVSHAPSLL
jgi:hypothetical protein